MFKAISRLLFGADEENKEDVESSEAVDEGWLVVPHEEVTSTEGPDEPLTCRPNISDASSDLDSETSEATSTPQENPSIISQPRYLPEVTLLKTRSWTRPHHPSHHALQRQQNRPRHEVQRQTFNLQQPSLRQLSH